MWIKKKNCIQLFNKMMSGPKKLNVCEHVKGHNSLKLFVLLEPSACDVQ